MFLATASGSLMGMHEAKLETTKLDAASGGKVETSVHAQQEAYTQRAREAAKAAYDAPGKMANYVSGQGYNERNIGSEIYNAPGRAAGYLAQKAGYNEGGGKIDFMSNTGTALVDTSLPLASGAKSAARYAYNVPGRIAKSLGGKENFITDSEGYSLNNAANYAYENSGAKYLVGKASKGVTAYGGKLAARDAKVKKLDQVANDEVIKVKNKLNDSIRMSSVEKINLIKEQSSRAQIKLLFTSGFRAEAPRAIVSSILDYMKVPDSMRSKDAVTKMGTRAEAKLGEVKTPGEAETVVVELLTSVADTTRATTTGSAPTLSGSLNQSFDLKPSTAPDESGAGDNQKS